ADAFVERDHRPHFFQLALMRLHIFTRADGSLLFAAEKDETDGTPGQQARGLDRARGFHHQSGIASVVERPAAQFPGIEMRAEDDHFVGLFVAPNFADYVLLLDGAAGFIGQQNRSEEHTSELQSHLNLVCRLLLEKKNTQTTSQY